MEDDFWNRLIATKFGIWHYFLFALLLGIIHKRKKFIVDWVPFFGLWVIYDMTRGIADNLSPIHVKEIYDLEKLLFGWMFGGQIPSEWWQEHKNVGFTLIAGTAYTMHFIGPISVALLIYYKSNDIETFKEYKYAFIMTIYAALMTFILYPVAAPWYVYSGGNGPRFDQPQEQQGLRESAGNLLDLDRFFDENLFGDIYTTFNLNLYAAMPSLHAAFAFFSAYYLIIKYKDDSKFVWIAAIYPVIVSWAAVYLNHHYIVDLIAGVVYSYASIRLVRFIRNKLKKSIVSEQSDLETEADVDQGSTQILAERMKIAPKLKDFKN